MIQRAGRIDRLGTEFNELLIYNCFQEQGLEALLGLVTRLQQRIATIDRRIPTAQRSRYQDEKIAILQELEKVSELAYLDEMRFPIINFNRKMGKDAANEIPLGIIKALSVRCEMRLLVR